MTSGNGQCTHVRFNERSVQLMLQTPQMPQEYSLADVHRDIDLVVLRHSRDLAA